MKNISETVKLADQSWSPLAVTYGVFCWLDLEALWHTEYEKKGGLILYS
ncbi:MAG TPA: hypothetical protein IAB63_09470 [Candidatus Onthocola gallistercoris]|uniref:Uncharacterized protein n=1 Tax=Candidatus Onthocola gallistercoris TaxID=2840876 RepID=A0A9D1HIZ9_9FIRM|nr:hypothetical protein [Candidatus Onthocola gallistercoris]